MRKTRGKKNQSTRKILQEQTHESRSNQERRNMENQLDSEKNERKIPVIIDNDQTKTKKSKSVKSNGNLTGKSKSGSISSDDASEENIKTETKKSNTIQWRTPLAEKDSNGVF